MARLSLVVTVHNNNCNTVSATNSATGRGLVLNIYGPLGSRVLNTIRQLSSPEHKEKVGGGGRGGLLVSWYIRGSSSYLSTFALK